MTDRAERHLFRYDYPSTVVYDDIILEPMVDSRKHICSVSAMQPDFLGKADQCHMHFVRFGESPYKGS
jgi:hypothetical protein